MMFWERKHRDTNIRKYKIFRQEIQQLEYLLRAYA